LYLPNKLLDAIRWKRNTLHKISAGLFLGFLGITSFSRCQSSQPIPFDGTVATPIHGVGHDYIDDLNETVSPATGSVSVRVQIPTPHDRGLQIPLYAFIYDSSGQWAVSANLVPCPGSTGSPCLVAAGLSEEGTFGAPTGGLGFLAGGVNSAGSAIGAGHVFSENLQMSKSFGAQGNAVCNYRGGYVYTDMSGGRHPLNFKWVPPGPDRDSGRGCPIFQIYGSGPQIGGDDVYKATIDDSGLVSVFDVHGNQLDPNENSLTDNPIHDVFGNFVNGTGRRYSQTTSSLTVPGLGGPYTYSVVPGIPDSRTQQPQTNNPVILPGSDQACTLAYNEVPRIGNYSGSVTLTLPNTQTFVFAADPTYGLLGKITYPTGAVVTYTWALNAHAEVVRSSGVDLLGCFIQYDEPAIAKRIVSLDGATPVSEEDFSYTTSYGTSGRIGEWTEKTTKVVKQDLVTPGHPSSEIDYTYTPAVPGAIASGLIDIGIVPVESMILYKDTNGVTLKRVNKTWANPNQLTAECTTLSDGRTAGTFYTYNGYLLIDKQEYDYGTVSLPCAPPNSPALRETATTFFQADNPSSVKVFGNGVLLAETDYVYNEYGKTPVSPAPLNFVAAGGNVVTTIIRKCFSTTATGTSVPCVDSIVHAWWDETGQVTQVQDARGNQTLYSYGDNFTSDDGTPPGSTHAFLSQITRPRTAASTHTQQFQYGYNQGLLRKAADVENGTSEAYYYSDPWKRLTEIDGPDGGQTTLSYDDRARSSTVSVRLSAQGQSMTTTSYEDALGRVTQAQLTSDPQGTIYTDTTYDGLGRKRSVSNPYRSKGEPTYGVTTYAYDALGRKGSQTQPDGSQLTWIYNGTLTTSIDEAGHSWQRTSDALGRLARVVEPGGAATGYSYSGLDNLLGVNQPGLSGETPRAPRSFSYDSLSRLLSATNPETGTISYGYDVNGNMSSKTDARGTAIAYIYDPLNRLTGKQYPDGTSSSCYRYDVPSAGIGTTNPIGRMTAEWTQSGSCPTNNGDIPTAAISWKKVATYDPTGRITAELQCPLAPCPAALPFSTRTT